MLLLVEVADYNYLAKAQETSATTAAAIIAASVAEVFTFPIIFFDPS